MWGLSQHEELYLKGPSMRTEVFVEGSKVIGGALLKGYWGLSPSFLFLSPDFTKVAVSSVAMFAESEITTID